MKILFPYRLVKENLAPLLPGLLVVMAVTVAACLGQSSDMVQRIVPLGSLVLAIMMGLILANIFPMNPVFTPGIGFSAQKILRLAVVLLGFRLSLSDIGGLGGRVILGVILVSGTTFALTYLLASRLGLGWKKALLMAAGVSICGAAAVAALGSAVRAEKEDAAFSIGIVTLFGTLFLFLYPVLFTVFRPDGLVYALWTGESVHEVAQVAAASAVLAEPLRALASTVKMFRVLLIVPLTLVLAWYGSRPGPNSSGTPRGRVTIPWFAVLFFASVMVNSWVSFPAGVRSVLVTAGNLSMTAAMGALGLGIRLKSLWQGSLKAILVGLFASVFISLFSWTVLTWVLK